MGNRKSVQGLFASEVLVAGGIGPSGLLGTAELYDPATGTFTATDSLVTARDSHAATLLPNGKVLIAAGIGSTALGYLVSAELYDPSTRTFMNTGSLATARYQHTTTLLSSGKVLVVGGYDGSNSATAELYRWW